MNLTEFLSKVEDECRAADVAVVLSPNARVYYQGMACNGFFESRYPVKSGLASVVSGVQAAAPAGAEMSPILAAALGGKSEEDVLSLLAHEYCHMQQFLEGSPLWVAAEEFNLWENWLNGTETDAVVLQRVWRRIVLLEADCETRVLALVSKLGLAMDAPLYAQRANSYLFFYSWALKNRRFYNQAPYEIREIVERMPKTMLPVGDYVDSQQATELVPLFDLCA